MRATKVNAGLAESNGRLLLGVWRDSLHVTCGLTACTPGSAPGPTLGNEYGKTLPFFTSSLSLPHLHLSPRHPPSTTLLHFNTASVDTVTQRREDWSSASVVKHTVVTDPSIRQPALLSER